MTLVLNGEQRWSCPNCTATALTSGEPNRFHPCAGLAGLLAPMVLDGTRCQVRTVLREDYVGGEDVQYDGDGRPVMSVLTDYGDGRTDCVVYAPTAHVKQRS